MDNGEDFGNTYGGRTNKIPKIKLQGEFKKIKSPMFYGERKMMNLGRLT